MRNLWHRACVWCGHSLTMAWAYVLIVAGVALDLMPAICDLANAPEVQAAITAYAGPYASHLLKALGIVTALVRLRTLRKGIAP
jgi:hypothetical protein